jgi:hypothetical protein
MKVNTDSGMKPNSFRPIPELSFLERLSLLVDQQWNWRENQASGDG